MQGFPPSSIPSDPSSASSSSPLASSSSPHPSRTSAARIALSSILLTPSTLLEDVAIILWALILSLLPNFPPWDVKVRAFWAHVMRFQVRVLEWIFRHFDQVCAHLKRRYTLYKCRDPDERDRLKIVIKHEAEVLSVPYRRLFVFAVLFFLLRFLTLKLLGPPDECALCREMLREFPLGSTVGRAICLPDSEKPSPSCLFDPHINIITDPTLEVSQASPYCPKTLVQRKCAESITLSDATQGPFTYEGLQACHLQMLLSVHAGRWPCGA